MKKFGFTTSVLHSDRLANVEHGSLHKPIHTSITFEHESAEAISAVFQGKQAGYTYARQVNPTVVALEKKISLMEDGVATCCFSTGMAAISATFLSLLRAGDHLIASSYLFGNTNSFFNTLKNFGIEVSFVDATVASNVESAIQTNTRAVFVETIANPCTQISDLEEIGLLCEKHKLIYVVDNTTTGPWSFRPKSVKASLVVNSLSKFFGGHGNALGGAVTETGVFDWGSFKNIYDSYKSSQPNLWGLQQIRKKGLRDTGATLSPEAAHHLSVGAETLVLRQERSSVNAKRLADWFKVQPQILKVFFPGAVDHPQHARASSLFKHFGSLMSIELNADVDCFAFIDALELAVIASNLGDNRTLIIPVAHTIYHEMGPVRRQQMGISDGTVRLSIGIEDFDDLVADFSQALRLATRV